eukprot:gene9343-biopygen2166
MLAVTVLFLLPTLPQASIITNFSGAHTTDVLAVASRGPPLNATDPRPPRDSPDDHHHGFLPTSRVLRFSHIKERSRGSSPVSMASSASVIYRPTAY